MQLRRHSPISRSTSAWALCGVDRKKSVYGRRLFRMMRALLLTREPEGRPCHLGSRCRLAAHGSAALSVVAMPSRQTQVVQNVYESALVLSQLSVALSHMLSTLCRT